eukprot:TRINITY_DN366_c0_g1_i1.p1 TRINITY_DN366_c0_g1~~TRINITY_DN366_c0_g1_i1.p1  ORF type:complete len:347 (+),score=65.28 TRINITY_DN366_c0_g1_i1:199-1239(+)
MSHSSGISISKELHDHFGNAISSGAIRFIKAQIKNEVITYISDHPNTGASLHEDLDKIPSFLDPTEPCYILFRGDEVDNNGNNLWFLMCYVPDKSKVREKMTYASSRSNLKQQLGSNRFSDEIFGTVPGDFNYKGYEAYRNMKHADVPLTWSEHQSITEKEGGVFVGGSGTAYVHGVAFPVEQAVLDAIKGLVDGAHNYVQIAIDADAERITLSYAKDIEAEELPAQVPNDHPRFHFHRYDHEYEGQQLQPIIFIYSCPDGSGSTKSAPVRLRMLYSSSKANAESILTSTGTKIDLKIEVNQGSELTEHHLSHQLHPEKPEEKKTFSRPKGPAKGGRKLIRSEKKE